MKADILDIKKEKVGEKTLNKGFIEANVNKEVLIQYLRTYMANNRQGTSSAKTRGEVAGSGIKPWRQKGTGRARVGDKRTPIWRHGGIVHGPQPKSWNLTLNKKVKKLALISALNHKFNDKKVLILDSFDVFNKKTKDSMKILKNMELNRNVLIVANESKPEMELSLRNISSVCTAVVDRLNAFQVFKADTLIVSKEALEALEKKLFK